MSIIGILEQLCYPPVVISLIAKIVYFRTTTLRWHIHYIRYTSILCNTETMLLKKAIGLVHTLQ